jgi:hypothetical protein
MQCMVQVSRGMFCFFIPFGPICNWGMFTPRQCPIRDVSTQIETWVNKDIVIHDNQQMSIFDKYHNVDTGQQGN